jgi:hypothetical protein
VLALGFVTSQEWLDVPSAGVDVRVAANTCSALTATEEGGAEQVGLRIRRDRVGSFEAPLGAIWCSCEAETARVVVEGAAQRRRALRLLSAQMRRVGGIEVLAALGPRDWTVKLEGSALTCVGQAFQGWVQDPQHGALAPPPTDKKGRAAALASQGLEILGVLEPTRPFAVVRSPKDRCYLAAAESKGDEMALRAADASVLAKGVAGAMAWCVYAQDAVFAVWKPKPSASPIVVARAPAERIGGLLGTREAAVRAGLEHPWGVLLAGDFNADARAALRASTVLDAAVIVSDETGMPKKPDYEVVALSFTLEGAFLSEVAPKVTTVCLPDVSPERGVRAELCVEEHPQLWRGVAGLSGRGGAEGPYPFWLGMFTGTSEPHALRALAGVLGFARRMSLLGFEPTSIEGVADTATGATVTGREGKGEVVAIGLTKARPWVHPLSPVHARWSLDGEPPVTRVPVGKTVVFHAADTLGTDKNARRAVAFRR